MENAIKKWFPVFVLPTLAAFCVGFIWPFIQALYLSFCSFITVDNAKWVGISNYVRALTDESFLHAFGFSVKFVIVATVLINVIAFLLALALTREIKGTNFFRTVFFVPNLIGGIVLGYIWNILINGLLSKLALPLLQLNAEAGFWGIIILLCWQQIGYMMIIYIAGLQAIPEDMMEAARIDGASSWDTLIHVTIPNMMPSFTICTFLSLTNGFKLYDQNLALTEGRPFVQAGGEIIKTTEMLALNIVNSFTSSATNRGVGQAKAVVFFIVVAGISLLQLKATRSKEVQQ